jgi:glycosyltransferase involved in cell wall biosynthesis
MTTEGTYPYVVGGVSSWCDLLINGLDEIEWQVLPVVAGGMNTPAFELPPHASIVDRIELWSSEPPPRRRLGRRSDADEPLPGALARGLMMWEASSADLLDALIRCRLRPDRVHAAFRSRHGWHSFLAGLGEALEERSAETSPAPSLDGYQTAMLYQTLYWVARTAAAATPPTDLLHVTAAGWAAVPALVHKALHGTPMLLTEHGVYVREAYLAAARTAGSPGERWVATRLARALARAAYAYADVVSPVTDTHSLWERKLGVPAERIRVIYNGIECEGEAPPLPGSATVVTVGRIDPLKDVHTMLRVAVEVTRRHPEARFLYYGPPTAGQEHYARSCHELHRRLGLGDRFRFMGPTRDPNGVLADADLVLLTSISEGMPMSLLEAMALGRPVVATAVGGVPDVIRGCGVVAPAGDVHGLAAGVVTLLRNPGLAATAGRRGRQRVARRFTRSGCLDGYRTLIHELSSEAAAA